MDLRTRVYSYKIGERTRVANAAGITPTYLYMLCVGLRPMDSVSLAKRIADATEGRVTWQELVSDAGPATHDLLESA